MIKLRSNKDCDRSLNDSAGMHGSLKAPVHRRLHLYGDIYTSPGLSLRQKELLMCAFLAQANMPEQLLGHLHAVCPLASQVIQNRSTQLPILGGKNRLSSHPWGMTTWPAVFPECWAASFNNLLLT